jgi:hypothetical protein
MVPAAIECQLENTMKTHEFYSVQLGSKYIYTISVRYINIFTSMMFVFHIDLNVICSIQDIILFYHSSSMANTMITAIIGNIAESAKINNVGNQEQIFE